jgi:DNA-binding transcriptional ArsR family regulator
MAADSTGMVEIFRALGHDVRLKLLLALREEELSVSELESRTGVAQPTLSQQLGIMRNGNLLLTRREGKAVHYRVNGALITSLNDFLVGFDDPPAAEKAMTKLTPARASSGGAAFARMLP